MKKLFCILLFLGLIVNVSAQPYTDSLKQVVENERIDSLRFDALYNLAAYYLNRDLSQSIDFGEQAIELAQQTGSIKLEVRALELLALARFFQGNFQAAQSNWLAAIDLLVVMESEEPYSIERMRLMGDRAQQYNNVGATFKNLGEYDKAIEYFQENLIIQERMGNLVLMARSKANIANVYYAFGLDYEKVLEYYSESLVHLNEFLLEHPEDEQGRQILAQIYMNIGITYKEINVWVFVIIWPILTLILIAVVYIQQVHIRRLTKGGEEKK